jgi:phage FluMu gp28-like protein
VDRRLQRGTDLFHSSADLTAAREFIEQCARWARSFRAIAEDLGPCVIDEQEGITAFVLRFRHSGAKIMAGSSNPKFFRSKGGDADADEFAFHPNPRELFKAMQPTAVVWGHQLRLWSTHNSEGSFFANLVKSAREGGDCGLRSSDCRLGEQAESTSPPSASSQFNPQSAISNPHSRASLHRVTLLEAVEQGLAERVRGIDGPNPVVRREFVESIRASCADEDSWNEEYLCRPGSGQNALLSYPLIQACETDARDALPDGGDPTHVAGTGRPLYAGFDVGRHHDRSVLWVLERVGDVFHTRLVRVLQDMTFTAQEQLLGTLMGDRAVKRLCIDSTGMGAMLAERLAQRWRHRVETVHFSAPVKSELAVPLLRLFQDRQIRVPADPAIRDDLHKVRRIVTASHNVRLDAPRDSDGHADRFWALALAYHAADAARGKVELPASLARKPVGW